ncbi:MAG: patatin-like phospholipase family protein, partial [Actinomycetota bacterium]|nr:patatin-like phospholipase family protein [Actinomycetota bacterium]
MTSPLRADLVLEGGGVRGYGLVGAVDALAVAGYHFPRVAGSSAGAVVAAFVAALQRAGEPLARLDEIARGFDVRRVRDRGPIARHAGPLSPLADLVAIVAEGGIFEGDYVRSFLAGALRDLGVEKFGDLRQEDEESSLPVERRYRLLVTASDLSRRRLARFPWDYAAYGVDPDGQRVVDALRASVSIPYYFEPVRLAGSTLVDGSVLSNFPIALFDRTDGRPPRWPTFGVRLSARQAAGSVQTRPVTGPVSMALALVETMLQAADAQHADDPCVRARTVFVDATG